MLCPILWTSGDRWFDTIIPRSGSVGIAANLYVVSLVIGLRCRTGLGRRVLGLRLQLYGKTGILQLGHRSVPDEISVVAELVHRACGPRRRTHPLFALYRRPFGGPCALATERPHPLPGVLVHARRGASEHVEKLGRVCHGGGDDAVWGVTLDVFKSAQSGRPHACPG